VPDWSKPIILVLLLLALWFGARSRMAARRARRLEGQHATLLRDVDVMQAALVPEIPARVGGAAVSVAYRPAEGPAAGGDFYDVFVPERGRIALILGDVAGHGHRALTQAALMRYTLRAYLQAGLEPRAALALAGRVLADRTMEHFATVVVGVYHTGEGCLTYASAGHPPPILLGLETREPLGLCASPPIGWTVPTGRRQTTVSLPLGAVACFFTDGLVEARCKDDLLGSERLREIVAALGPRPDATKLLARVRAAALATPDDMAACVLVPQIAGIAARTHIEELEADAQALDDGRVRRFLEACLVPTPDIEQVIERAHEISAVFGTALVRVTIEATTAAVTVAAPELPPVAEASMGPSSHPAGQPSGAG
jgi:Stage II sporulation protein E (SpoIIE)